MVTHHNRRLYFTAGDQFSFSSPVSEHEEYGTWAEKIKSMDNSFGKRDSRRKLGPWVRRIHLPDSSVVDESDSNSASPPLWKSASPESRSNISRAQMIAMRRQEMMDLVRNMPETAYELSLRDIVESPSIQSIEMAPEDEEAAAALTVKGRERKKGTKTGIRYSVGFLLKLFVPSTPVRQRENFSVLSKISPTTIAAAAAEEDGDGGLNSGCSSGRGRQRWKFGACYSFFYRQRRSRSMEI